MTEFIPREPAYEVPPQTADQWADGSLNQRAAAMFSDWRRQYWGGESVVTTYDRNLAVLALTFVPKLIEALQPPAVDGDVAWMIECGNGFTGWWTGREPPDCRFFDKDPNKGVRFATKEEAEQVIKTRGNSCMIATDHLWLDGPKTQPPADKGEDQTEYCWLVENGKQASSGLAYLTMGQMGSEWTEDPWKALHFSRREDAERFSAECEDAWRIVQHGFDGARHLANAIPREIHDRYRVDAEAAIALACAAVKRQCDEDCAKLLVEAGEKLRDRVATAEQLLREASVKLRAAANEGRKDFAANLLKRIDVWIEFRA
jgi:hypothetical protein